MNGAFFGEYYDIPISFDGYSLHTFMESACNYSNFLFEAINDSKVSIEFIDQGMTMFLNFKVMENNIEVSSEKITEETPFIGNYSVDRMYLKHEFKIFFETFNFNIKKFMPEVYISSNYEKWRNEIQKVMNKNKGDETS